MTAFNHNINIFMCLMMSLKKKDDENQADSNSYKLYRVTTNWKKCGPYVHIS